MTIRINGASISGKLSVSQLLLTPMAGTLLRTLDNPNAYGTSVNDWFGQSVAISGDRAIVGADQEDDAGGSSSGKAYVFSV